MKKHLMDICRQPVSEAASATTRFFKAGAFVISVLVAGCGAGGDSGESKPPTQQASLPIPKQLQSKINADASNVQATISIDGGAEQNMAISDGAATFEIDGLAPGSHSIVITFYQTAETAGTTRIVLARNTSQVTIVAGQTANLGGEELAYETASFDDDDDQIPNIEDDDNDNDGIKDDDEIVYGLNPFDADSDDDGDSDATDVRLVSVATSVPAAVLERADSESVSIAARITVDAGEESDMTIADNRATTSVAGLVPGQHSIIITFYQTAGADAIELARHTGTVTVVAGQETQFGEGTLEYTTAFDHDEDDIENIDDPDNDNDTIADADEARYEKNPFLADSDNDDIADADEVAVQISGRGDHTCIVLLSRKVRCWGYNADGELGNGQSGNNVISFVPVATSGITTALSVHTSPFHSCARLNGGQVRCWGSNDFEEIADGTVDSDEPLEVASLAGAKDLQLWAAVTCGILANDALACRGDVTGLNPNPIETYIGDELLAAGPGEDHACVVVSTGAVSCFGNYTWGQLGNNNVLLPPVGPVEADGISTAISVGVGANHSCALLQNGTVKCWGANALSQIGDGTTSSQPVPVNVGTVSGATALAVGLNHNCALLNTGAVRCWGDNSDGQLGNGSDTGSIGDPVLVSGITNAISISAGQSHSCAVLANGRVQCWGSNADGQLGNGQAPGDLPSSRTPVYVSGF